MRYIDKQQNGVEGERYSRDFVKSSFDETRKSFIPAVDTEASFDRLKHYAGDKLKKLLISEQGGFCCYCMKRLEGNVSSDIEHIIPKKCSKDEYNYYIGKALILNHHVAYATDFAHKAFNTKEDIEHETKLPHMTSYYNLAASCKDMPHCNGERGKKRILPLPLMDDIELKVFYSYAGSVTTFDDLEEYNQTFDALKLNCDTLINIRLLWRKVAQKNHTVGEVKALATKEERLNFMLELFNKKDYFDLSERWRSFVPQMEGDSDEMWNEFLHYDWFFDYYATHDNHGNRI